MFSWLSDSSADPNAPATTESTEAAQEVAPVPKRELSHYTDDVQKAIETLLNEAKQIEGWEVVNEQDDIKVYLKNEEENPIKSAKATGIVKKSPKEIVDVIQDMENYKKVDTMFQNGHTVEHFDKLNEILYANYSSGYMLVANRDFCYLENRLIHEDGTITIACFSVEHPDCPEIEGNVRGHIYFSGWLFRPFPAPADEVESSGSDVWTETVFLAQIDPKGWLPVMLINQASQEIGSSIANIRQFFESKRAEEEEKQKEQEGEKPAEESGSWFW
eukprot:TRINITY_DN6298_c0_g1_i1.p1 TRINITY_DN6298_c0_g1~~TRINITY_DN6298_c0_g1_i1.p1  ORF type:complete len:298 (+),score=127.14 TRINITY_DN6298_c0_g1_i1:75-896(+)